jgi:hypothetical protein
MFNPSVVNTIIRDFIIEKNIRKFFVEHSLKVKNGVFDTNRTLYGFIRPIKSHILELTSRITSNDEVIQFVDQNFDTEYYVGITSHGYEFYMTDLRSIPIINSIEVINGIVSQKKYIEEEKESPILDLYPTLKRFLVTDKVLVRNDGQQYFRFIREMKPHIAIMIGIFKNEDRKIYTRWTVEQYRAGRKPIWIQLSDKSISVYYRVPQQIQLDSNEREITFM